MKKKVMKFPDLVLQAIMKGLDAITKCTNREELGQHSGDGAGGTLDFGMSNLRQKGVIKDKWIGKQGGSGLKLPKQGWLRLESTGYLANAGHQGKVGKGLVQNNGNTHTFSAAAGE